MAILLITDFDVLRVMRKNAKNPDSNKILGILNIVYFGIIQLLFFTSVRIIIAKSSNE